VTPARATFTGKALQELRWIVAESGAERADRVVDRIVATADLLAERPLSGRERRDISRGLRSFAVPPFVIFYRPLTGGVRVMRVVHGHRDLPRALGDHDMDQS
jgi:toxin ParE1/3/4